MGLIKQRYCGFWLFNWRFSWQPSCVENKDHFVFLVHTLLILFSFHALCCLQAFLFNAMRRHHLLCTTLWLPACFVCIRVVFIKKKQTRLDRHHYKAVPVRPGFSRRCDLVCKFFVLIHGGNRVNRVAFGVNRSKVYLSIGWLCRDIIFTLIWSDRLVNRFTMFLNQCISTRLRHWLELACQHVYSATRVSIFGRYAFLRAYPVCISMLLSLMSESCFSRREKGLALLQNGFYRRPYTLFTDCRAVKTRLRDLTLRQERYSYTLLIRAIARGFVLSWQNRHLNRHNRRMYQSIQLFVETF